MLRPNELNDFAGLVFAGHDDGVRADATEGFWALWRHDKEPLRQLGFRVTKMKVNWQTEKWVVFIDLGKVAIDLVNKGVADLQRCLFAAQRKSYEHDLAVAAREAEKKRDQDADRDLVFDIARGKLVSRFGDLADDALIAAAKATGRKCWSEWHSFCVSKAKLTSLISERPLTLPQAVFLLDLVDQTYAKAEAARETIVARPDAVDWSDDEVVRAVETLTCADSDQATAENGEGWSKADSSRGHWCAGMIKRGGADRSIGIDAARGIVGKYQRQLGREAG